MKFCLSVAEFNPLHFGHIRLLDKMNEQKDCVKAVILSGNFCQRGEMAVLGKYTRAKHAILAGADIVFELPVCFALSPAEIFALGAIKLLDALPGEKTLYFGTEVGTKSDFVELAKACADESKPFKQALKEELNNGESYAKARANALKKTRSDLNLSLLDNPNSILGIEYKKAMDFFGSDMDFQPVRRENNHLSYDLKAEYPSAMAIRNKLAQGQKKKIKKFVPDYVYDDLPDNLRLFDDIAIFKLVENDAEYISKISDCTEGLENRIKALASNADNLHTLVQKLETRRYTKTRIQRIIINNALGINRDFTEKCLKSKLYLKVLAVAEDKKEIFSSLNSDKCPVIARKSDADKLTGVAKACFEKDSFANRAYNIVNKCSGNEYDMKIVKR